MQLMNVKEWSQLDVNGKREWLAAHTQRDLEHILEIVGEMLNNASELDAELAMLPPNEELNAIRTFTNESLRDMEKCIVNTLIRLPAM